MIKFGGGANQFCQEFCHFPTLAFYMDMHIYVVEGILFYNHS